MRRLVVVAALALASSCATGKAPGARSDAPRAPLTPSDIAKLSTQSIVHIEAGSDKIGTGFIVDKGGVIATNLHVVAGESSIKVKLSDGTEYPVTLVTGVDVDCDLALLKIATPRELPALRLGDSDAVTAGDQVVAIGNPLGLDNTVTAGLVSQIRRGCGRRDASGQRCEREVSVLQISVAISPGSSGGPLFNAAGEVVGVTTGINTLGQSINFAMPGNYLKPLVAKRIAVSPDQFARDTKQLEDEISGDDSDKDKDKPNVRIQRRVPNHELAVLDGCKVGDIEDLVQQIGDAIESGAPLYNQGKHEACYRIYEGTALKFEHDAPCPGVRSAFGDGLLRANGLKTYTEKAWAMRDTFDGLIDVARRWAEKHPEGAPPAAKPNRPAKPKK
jgi:S1-C subfamily serine protease